MTEDEIKRYWTDQAVRFGASSDASWSDHAVIDLEVQAIGQRLLPGMNVLDVGCANGISSFRYAAERDVRVIGIDFAPEMIAAAEARLKTMPDGLQKRITFRVGDARSLEFPDAGFEAVISTRVIINIPDADEQRAALLECARVVKPGGMLLLSEATRQGWQRLNALRAECGLEPIPMPWFNRYLDEADVASTLETDLELVELVNFASSYYVATRVLKPVLAGVLDGPIEVGDPGSELNRWAATLPAAGDYGTQKLFVYRKRAGSNAA